MPKRNIAAGYYDSTGFHPIRSSPDYDPDRAGDDYSDTKPKKKKKGVKKKAKGKAKRNGPPMKRVRRNSVVIRNASSVTVKKNADGTVDIRTVRKPKKR